MIVHMCKYLLRIELSGFQDRTIYIIGVYYQIGSVKCLLMYTPSILEFLFPHVIFQLFQIFISEMRYLIVFLVYISLMMNKGELLSFVLLVFILLWTD